MLILSLYNIHHKQVFKVLLSSNNYTTYYIWLDCVNVLSKHDRKPIYINNKNNIWPTLNIKSHTWADAFAHGTVTSSEFFSHIVNNVGAGGLGNNVSEDMMTKNISTIPTTQNKQKLFKLP